MIKNYEDPFAYWLVDQSGYAQRGRPFKAPFEIVNVHLFKHRDPDAEEYWNLHGMKRDAPVVMTDGREFASVREFMKEVL